MRAAVPAHYIKPNEVSRRPKCWIYLDTEAHDAPDATGSKQTWRLGVAAHDHRSEGADRWRPPEMETFATPADLWAWVDARTRSGERMVLIAHNLAYDLRIAQAFTILPALGWRLDRIRLDYEQGQVRWRRDGRTIQMVDSIAWVNAPLAVLADEVGMEKLELPAFDGPDDEWMQRCITDVAILRTVWRRILDWLHTEDLGTWQPSGASQAWSAWRHRFLTHRVLVHDDPDARDIERRAVWAGRAEAWRRGVLDDGAYHEVDFQCAYLAAARDCDMPTRPVGRKLDPTAGELERYLLNGRVLARVHVETDVPVLPVEMDGGICWPVGTYETVVWDPELRIAWEAGARVTVLEALVYKPEPALRAWAEWLWPLATDETGTVDPIVRRMAKHWARALVGRFGVRYRELVAFGDARGEDVSLVNVLDRDTKERYRLLMLGGDCWREGDMIEGENAVPSILGYVASETRARLWRAMVTAGLDELVHVDTDGMLVTDLGLERLAAAAIPGLRVKGSYRRVEVFATRQMVLDEQVRASGVPKRARRVGPQTFEATIWPQLSTSLAEGESGAVRLRRRQITLRGSDHRRVPTEGGRTVPYLLGEGVDRHELAHAV